jgi:hypothetical protein
VQKKRLKQRKRIRQRIKQEKKACEKEGRKPDVLKIEGHEKARITSIRVKKKHVDEKASKSNLNSQLTRVVMHSNRVLG